MKHNIINTSNFSEIQILESSNTQHNISPQFQKLTEAIAREEEFIKQMEAMDYKKLDKHLNIIRQLMKQAYNSKKEDALMLLQEYEKQIIEAKVRKLG